MNRSTATPISTHMQQSSSSSDESTSPNLSSSPLQSMGGISSALPTSQANGYSRDNSYGSSASGGEADLPVDNEEVYNDQEDENEALKKYKGGLYFRLSSQLSFTTHLTRFLPTCSSSSPSEQMHSYIASRFASFKSDLERKTRAEGTDFPPTGLPQRRSNANNN